MSQDQMDNLDHQVQKMEEISLLDFPDEILIKFFENMDIPSRLKLRRVNKKFLLLSRYVKNKLDKIEITIDKDELSVEPSYLNRPYRSNHLFRLMTGFDNWSRSTYVNTIIFSIKEWDEMNEHYSNTRMVRWMDRLNWILESLSRFIADSLIFHSLPNNNFHMLWCSSTIPALAQNIRSIEICTCSSYPYSYAYQLCMIRQIMVEGDCKLESFEVMVSDKTRRYFEWNNLSGVEGNLQTTVQNGPRNGWHQISFKKH